MLLNGKEALYAERLMTGARPEEDLREGGGRPLLWRMGVGGEGRGWGGGAVLGSHNQYLILAAHTRTLSSHA